MRYSKQRQEILNIVMNSYDHPTAMMIYKRMKNIIPNISLGTVYRNLNILSQKGLIKKISMKDGNDRFDKTVINHNHMYCKYCGKVIDIKAKLNSKQIKKIENETGFKITNCNFNIDGICFECQKEREV